MNRLIAHSVSCKEKQDEKKSRFLMLQTLEPPPHPPLRLNQNSDQGQVFQSLPDQITMTNIVMLSIVEWKEGGKRE